MMPESTTPNSPAEVEISGWFREGRSLYRFSINKGISGPEMRIPAVRISGRTSCKSRPAILRVRQFCSAFRLLILKILQAAILPILPYKRSRRAE